MEKRAIEPLDIIFGNLNKYQLFFLRFVCKKWKMIVDEIAKPEDVNFNTIYCEIIDDAVHNSQIEIIKWLIGNFLIPKICIMNAIAENGNLNMLIWAVENDFEWNEDFGFIATANNHLSLLKFAKENEFPFLDEEIMETAVEFGNIEIVKWMKDNGFMCTSEMMNLAASSGNIEMMDWLLQNGSVPDKYIALHGATSGSILVMRWIDSNAKIPIDREQVCGQAVESGNIDLIQWCLDHGYPWKVRFSYNTPNLEVLQWIIKNGLEINELAVSCAAAQRGDLETVIWGVECGLAWNELAVKYAIEGEHYDVLEYLMKQWDWYKCPKTVFCQWIDESKNQKIKEFMHKELEDYHKEDHWEATRPIRPSLFYVNNK